ncbi:MAG: VWA domain-containing protein [Termitinemataceae bacterium]|nr:MAG: VWA domain-containing protein [Termitinemataceae bacterium]
MNIVFQRPILAIIAVFSPLIIFFLGKFFRNAFTLNLSVGTSKKKFFSLSLRWIIFMRVIRIMEYASVAFLLLAASGPQIITRETVWLDRGCDILFILDCSPSMAGLDMNGENRFTAAKKLMYNFVTNRPSDSIGLVAVGNDAAMLVPPTIDRAALLSRLESLQIGELGDGTALGMGISLASLHLDNSSAHQKVVVLITDGENNAGAVHPITAAGAIAEAEISFYIIGVGRRGDVPIDYVDPLTKVRRTGTFDSRFNPDALESLAKEGGGTYLNAPSDTSFAEAFSLINKKEATVSRGSFKEKQSGIKSQLLSASLVLLLLCRFIKKYILGQFL